MARGITPEDVVHAGVRLTRSGGLTSLTLRAVALDLGVQSPSLYHHVPGGLDELQALVVDSIMADLGDEQRREESPEMGPWDRLERPLRDLGRLVEDYPGVLQYVLTTGRNRPLSLGGAQQTIEELLQSELGRVTPAAWLLVHTYVTGWAFVQRPSSAAAREHGFDKLGAVLSESEGMDEEKVLFEGLRALLAGLLVSAQVGPQESEPEAVRRTLGKFLR
ncbi:MAG: transcriptional regulator, TetR family [Frankiales bacterium]|nr:transcriptional regulator, TetR family [Frankiales bacterium]